MFFLLFKGLLHLNYELNSRSVEPLLRNCHMKLQTGRATFTKLKGVSEGNTKRLLSTSVCIWNFSHRSKGYKSVTNPEMHHETPLHSHRHHLLTDQVSEDHHSG